MENKTEKTNQAEEDVLSERVSETLDKLLGDIYEKTNITKGDITPEQSLRWDELCRNTANLFRELIEQNTEKGKGSEEMSTYAIVSFKEGDMQRRYLNTEGGLWGTGMWCIESLAKGKEAVDKCEDEMLSYAELIGVQAYQEYRYSFDTDAMTLAIADGTKQLTISEEDAKKVKNYLDKNGTTYIGNMADHIAWILRQNEDSAWRKLKVRVFCNAVYESSINVPSGLSLDEALEYAAEHIEEIPVGELTYVPGGEELSDTGYCFEE